MDAVAVYDGVKNMFFMPVMLKSICDNFFEGLVVQLDFHSEFNNGNTFKELIHGKTDGRNNFFIIPRMLDTSDECLVMEYEPSQSIVGNEDKINKHTLLKCFNGICLFTQIMLIQGFLHADMHFGNYGIRNPETPEKMQIVLYDYGHMYDIRGLSYDKRTNLLLYFSKYNFTEIIYSIIDDTIIIERILYLISDHNEIGYKPHFQQNIKQFCQYVTINGIKLDKEVIQWFLMSDKSMNAIIITDNIENDIQMCYMRDEYKKSPIEYLYKYYPHDDLKILRDFIIQN